MNGKPIERVKEFKYLGRTFTENDNESKCIQMNLESARRRWNNIGRILKKEGASAKCMARFLLKIKNLV